MHILNELSPIAKQPFWQQSSQMHQIGLQKQSIEKDQQKFQKTVQATQENKAHDQLAKEQNTKPQPFQGMYDVLKNVYGQKNGINSPADLKQKLQSLADKFISFKVDRSTQTFESKLHQFKMEISREAYSKYEATQTSRISNISTLEPTKISGEVKTAEPAQSRKTTNESTTMPTSSTTPTDSGSTPTSSTPTESESMPVTEESESMPVTEESEPTTSTSSTDSTSSSSTTTNSSTSTTTKSSTVNLGVVSI